MIKFVFLSENKTESEMCSAEHGLSIFIETEELKLLFDTGASDMFAKNAAARHVDLKEAEALVISHGHFDHTGGVPEFCRINGTAPVYIHKDAFGESFGMTNGRLNKRSCGIRWSEEEKDMVRDRISFTDGPLWLTDNIVISGTIPDIKGMEPTETFYKKTESGELVKDTMSHEQFLAVENGAEGVFIFSGCSHKGIIPVLEYTKRLFPDRKIAGLIAGMHLYCVSDDIRREVVDKVIAEHPDIVMPVHCTGIDAICMLKNALGDKCVIATAGERFEY